MQLISILEVFWVLGFFVALLWGFITSFHLQKITFNFFTNTTISHHIF